ncbi:Outward-rectifier potassium channel TOK1, partial [Leucoagaricus sp. SymC.cos]
SSIFVPFAILLAIPGLTEHWYIRTNDHHEIIGYEANPLYIHIMIGVSISCAVITNACLLVRFFEKRVKIMTIICIIAKHILATIVIIMFVIEKQKDDGFILGQAFWMTLCSTIAFLVTNVTLILDHRRNPGDECHKSGLTEKQRSLTIIIIVLLCYIAFGAAVHTSLLSLRFIDALYFTVVCIETVGNTPSHTISDMNIGDIDPQTKGARVFSFGYTAVWILILAIAIGLIREALLEAIQLNLYVRIRRARKQRVMNRWIIAVKWRLNNARLPIWVPADPTTSSGPVKWRLKTKDGGVFGGDWPNPHRPRRMRLNIRALSEAQLQATAMEAGAPLSELLPRHPDHHDHHNHPEYSLDGGPDPISPTHHRVGRMISVLGNFAYAVSIGQSPARAADSEAESPLDNGSQSRSEFRDDSGTGLTIVELEREERRMFVVRITIALGLFSTFWLVGSAIFVATEKWSFGLALYFCFITFSTVGYGDPVPRTPSGRSFFVGWALCGIATMTILISLLADRYSERYKNMIFAAESTIVGNEGSEERHRPTASQSSNSRVTFNGRKNGDPEKTVSSNLETRDIFASREVLSRLESLKALVVDEGAHKGRMIHILESELQSMLLSIRRSRQQLGRDE